MVEIYYLRLPSNRSARANLESQLKDYQDKIKHFKEEHPDFPSNLANRANASSIYNIALIEKLLKKKIVDVREVSSELEGDYGFFNEAVYDNAVFSLEVYCEQNS